MQPRQVLVGDWLVDLRRHRLSRQSEEVLLEPRQLAVLAALCQRAGEVLSAEELLDVCWPGEAVGTNPVHKAIAALRRAFGDSAQASRYIVTVRKQGYQLTAPVRWLSGERPRSSRGAWRSQSPFRGLEPFGPAHAGVFYGRDREIAELQDRLAQRWQAGEPLVLLLGPSGSGKTSLVQAGLLPALIGPLGESSGLRIDTAATADLGALGDFGPWSCLAGALLDWDAGPGPLLGGYSIDTLASALRDRVEDVLTQLRLSLAARTSADARAAPPLLVLDRLEALFGRLDRTEVLGFIDCVEALVRSRLLLVLALCRNDFYAHLAEHAVLMRGKSSGAHVDLASPDAAELAQIIRLPAQAAGLVFGTDPSGMHRLDDRLCADAARAQDALPLLQYTLQSLYEARAPGNELTWASYDAMGGLEGAIGRRADEVLAALPPAQQAAAARVLPRLMSLSSEEALPVARWLRATEIQDADEQALVQALVEARLLVADSDGAVAGYRVAHESLLRQWPRVVDLVAQLRAHLASRHELTPWVQRWVEGGQASALLLPQGALLLRASKSVADAPRLFTDEEQAFVARANQRIRRQGRLRWAGVLGVAWLAVMAASVAVRNADLAEISAARELQSRRLVTFMLGDLVDQLRPIGKLDLLARIGEQGVALLSTEGLPPESPTDALQRAKALVVIGEVNSSRGKGRVEVAVAALEQARRLLQPLAGASGLRAADYYATLGAAEFWLGQIAFDAGDVDTASAAMNRYREACERWRREMPQDATATAELGFALNSLGSIAMRRGAWQEARQWIEQSLSLKLAALAAQPQDVDLQDAVASSRAWLGQLAYVRGDVREASTQIEAARVIQEALLARRSGEAVRLHDFGVLHVRQAEVRHGQGRYLQAIESLQAAVDLLGKALAHEPGNVYWASEIRHAETALLMARLDAGQPIDAQAKALKARMLAEPTDSALSREYLWRAAWTRLNAATAGAAVQRADWPAVQAALGDAQPRLEALRELRPGDWQLMELQARLAWMRMTALHAQGLQEPFRDTCRQAAAGLQPAVDAGQAGFVLEIWLMASSCAGHALDELAWRGRLTAGEYQPFTLAFHSPTLAARR